MSELTKKCLGWHCDLRDKCQHHALPAENLVQYFQPRFHSELCDVFEPKRKSWGEEKEPIE